MKFTILVLLVCCSAVPVHGDEWSSFQNGGRLTSDSATLPTSWSSSEGIAWQVPIEGYGQSSPVVHEKHIYCTSCSGENKENLHITCFDSVTGQSRWRYDLQNSSPEKNSNYVSRSAPTPVCDVNGVIALFEGGNVVALGKAGELLWQRDLVADYGPIKARHGLGSSLEQNDEHVFVWIERAEDPYLLALEKASGETVWKSPGVGSTSWSSPRLVPVRGTNHLVLSAIGKLVGYDPASGDLLWSFDGIGGNSTPTPIPLGDGRFLIGATTGRGNSSRGKAIKSNGVIQIFQRDGKFQAKYLWQAKRATSSFSSPLVFRGHAYFVNQTGVVYCLDVETGRELYAKRTGGSAWATPIASGRHVYLFGKNGNTTIIEAGKEFRKIATNSLWQSESNETQVPGTSASVLYAASISDSNLLLRSGNRLYNVGSGP